MRKRAQRKSKPIIDEPKHVSMKARPIKEEKTFKLNFKKNWWVAVTLLAIFLLILFFNTFYNSSSEISINQEGEGFNKFYLSGPDPYYNMRLVEETYKTGRYPFYSEDDPLLNYPLERTGARPPLFNMMALGFSRLLTPFMSEVDAIGYSMQFIPALFGALLILPVYFLGKEIFNSKAGLIGALFVALIPIHISSGHGSAYSLFDHDSFNLLLFFLTFLFLIKSLKEKDPTKSFLYALLGGIPLAALSMTWVKSQYLYMVIVIYAIIQMFIDVFRNKFEFNVFRTTSVVLFTGYFVSLPVVISTWGGFKTDINFLLCLAATIFGLICYITKWKKIPWTISIPAFFSIGIIMLIITYPPVLENVISNITFLSPLNQISQLVYGSGIYGNKVSMTIAEANTYQISHSVMSFGPALYWLGWTGLIFLMHYFYRNNKRKDYLFIIVLFIVSIWLTFIAGRFINDMVPVMALLSGWIVWMLLEKIDYKQMIRNIRSAGGGFHGIRRGVKFLHVFGILFIAFLVLLPNAFIAFDAAVPTNAPTQNGTSNLKRDMFGEEHSGAFGLGIGKERYWADAFKWLSEQDNEINNPDDRPAFISWWDYGFYEVAMGDHPTVADNFQDGIPPASNFHTATSEQEAVAVWIVRLLEGEVKHNQGKLSEEVISVLEKHLDSNHSNDVINWIENPKISPSYNEPIQKEFHKYIRDDVNDVHLFVGSQWVENAAYHDIADLLTNDTYGLLDEELTWLYHDLQKATGWSIRYYGVEGYDKQIFNIFAFLSDKSLLMVGAPEDDYVEALIKGYVVDEQNFNEIEGSDWEMTLLDYLNMPDSGWTTVETTSGSRELNKRYMVPTDQDQNYLDAYFDTMFYRTYFGPKEPQEVIFKVQLPCSNMKHFYAEYISDLSKMWSQYYSGIAAVVIAKYYEGAVINGTVLFDGKPLDVEAVIRSNLDYSPEDSFLIDHDKMNTVNGSFSLIAGADSILQIRRYPEMESGIPWYGGKAFVLKEINLNLNDSDAMRKSENWERNLGNITIEPANIGGYVYENLDNNDTYDPSVDKSLSDITVYILEFLGEVFDNNNMIIKNTDENGSYNADNLLPGIYRIMALNNDGLTLHFEDFPMYSGNTSYNISKPKDATVTGMVYYDENQNEKYDSGDTIIKDADVNITYEGTLIDNTKTESDGSYEFKNLLPGWTINLGEEQEPLKINEYTITVTKYNNEGILEYESYNTILPEENKTTFLNISIDLAPVSMSGYARYNAVGVNNTQIVFEPDQTTGGINTAEKTTVNSDENGFYQTYLIPGTYNITAEYKEGGVIVYSYEDNNWLLPRGEVESVTYNIDLIKESVTVSGTMTYNNSIRSNIDILFTEKDNYGIVNAVTSDENGQYSVELTPGSYNVTAGSDIFNISGVNYSYIISEETNELNDLTTDLTFNVKLMMKEEE